MSARKQPDIWVEISPTTYPADVSTTTRRSTRAMAFPTKIVGRIKAGSYSTISRALSDWRGNIEAAVFSWEEEDSDGVGRQLAAELGRTALAHPEVSVMLLSEAGRKASLTPRIIQRGYLSRSPHPQPNRKAAYESVDALGSKFYRFDPEAPLQSEYITREDLTVAGVYKTPADIIGKPYNIIIGEHSTVGSTTKCGDPADIGMIPPDYIGRCVYPLNSGSITETDFGTVPPPVLTSATVVGAGGSETYYYAVTMILPDGTETAMSNIMTVTGAPPVSELELGNHIALTWDAPSGWATQYATYIAEGVHFRVLGRSHNPPTTYLDMGFQTTTGGYYNDGGHDGSRTDIDVEKRWVSACGTTIIVTTTDGTILPDKTAWGVFVVALGAVTLLKIYGSDLAETDQMRVALDDDDANVVSPLSAAWPHAEPYVELNGVRVTLFYARGAILQAHLDGTVTFAVDCCGVEDVGDGSGDPITEAANGLQWLISEIALNHYKTGAYGTLATYADGASIIKTTAFAAMQLATVGFIGGRGYQMHLAITEKVTLSEVIGWWCETFTAHIGITQQGQIAVHVVDVTASAATARHMRQRIEIDGPLPEPEIAEDEVENRCKFRFDWDPDRQKYRVEQIKIEDFPSQAMYGVKDVEEEFLGLRCTRDETTARHSMGRRIRLNKTAPIYQPIPVGMIGYEENLGDLLRVTHEDGLGSAGYTEAPFFIVRQELELNGPQERVVLTARYVGDNLVTPVTGATAQQRAGVTETATTTVIAAGSESL